MIKLKYQSLLLLKLLENILILLIEIRIQTLLNQNFFILHFNLFKIYKIITLQKNILIL